MTVCLLVRTALLALIGFMPTMGEGALGSLDYTADERKQLAKRSVSFCCDVCKKNNSDVLPEITANSKEESAEAKELASQIQFKASQFCSISIFFFKSFFYNSLVHSKS